MTPDQQLSATAVLLYLQALGWLKGVTVEVKVVRLAWAHDTQKCYCPVCREARNAVPPA